MKYIHLSPVTSGDILVQYYPGADFDSEVGLKISFHFSSYNKAFNKRDCVKHARSMLEKKPISWITPGFKEWTIDLEEIKKEIPELANWSWFSGNVSIEPDFEDGIKETAKRFQYIGRVVFYITEELVLSLEKDDNANMIVPIEITDSLRKFTENNKGTKTAFIMMRFGEIHSDIHKSIQRALSRHDINGLRADDKQYHDDLYYNILTYIHGCDFGIAVFDRIEEESFNPNVSLEVGYFLGMGKNICLLKDRTLKSLHTDLVGRLYRTFDVRNLDMTISNELSSWLTDKGIV